MKKIQVALLVILISSGIGFGVNQVSSQTVQTSTILTS
jgi:hypothetical protein